MATLPRAGLLVPFCQQYLLPHVSVSQFCLTFKNSSGFSHYHLIGDLCPVVFTVTHIGSDDVSRTFSNKRVFLIAACTSFRHNAIYCSILTDHT